MNSHLLTRVANKLPTHLKTVAQHIYRATPAYQKILIQKAIDKRKVNQILRRYFKDKKIKIIAGPYEGLSYLSHAHGSTLLPKIFGTYEQPLMKYLNTKKYKQVIVIGCAEGYYAAGIAYKNPKINVVASDIDSNALAMCTKIKKINNLQNLVIQGQLDHIELDRLIIPNKTLIVCDIEGSEDKMIDPEKSPNLKHCDIICELHDDLLGYNITEKIAKRLANTHENILIYDCHNRKIPKNCKCKVRPEDLFLITDENRDGLSRWMISKSASSATINRIAYNIAFACDANYFQHLSAAVTSLSFNNKLNKINIHLYSNHFDQENKDKLQNSIHSQLHKIYYHKSLVSGRVIKNFNSPAHITKMAYQKIIIPEDINTNNKKLLILDCDLLVLGDISDIFEIDMDGNVICAVIDPGFNGFDRLGLKEGTEYFNSGVFLVNVKEWKKRKITDKIFRIHADKYKVTTTAEQDEFNLAMLNNWKSIDPKYNLQTIHYAPFVHYKKIKNLDQAISNPLIVHFTTSSKPWQFSNNHPHKRNYIKYLKISGYKEEYHIDTFNSLKELAMHFISPREVYLVSYFIKYISKIFKPKHIFYD